MRIRCYFGIHNWETVRLVEQRLEYVTTFLDGDMCKCCGTVKKSDIKSAMDVFTMLVMHSPRNGKRYPVTLHENIRSGKK